MSDCERGLLDTIAILHAGIITRIPESLLRGLVRANCYTDFMTLSGSAHLIAGNESAVPRVLELLAEEGVQIQGNPDIYTRVYTAFGIDEARELRERASLGAISGGNRYFIIAVSGMTSEAQNALLKTLEEPPSGSVFFIIIPSPEGLLPTLRSRMQMLVLESSHPEELIDARAFLAAAPAQRLEILKPLLEKGDDERRDIGGIIAFLSSLERALSGNAVGLETVYRARKYMGDKGALVKPLLEQVALLAPRI